MVQPLIQTAKSLDQAIILHDSPAIRAADLLMAVLLLALFSPVMLICAVAVRLGPAARSSTVKNASVCTANLTLVKFRSMVEGAEAKTGAVLSWSGDPRVTRLGQLLRASHLDELPQLFNVLKGDMAMIGPRPERPDFVKVFNQQVQFYALRARVRPGITGLAQIYLPYDASPEEKLTYDLYYLRQRGWHLDLLISCHTALKMVGMRPLKTKPNMMAAQ